MDRKTLKPILLLLIALHSTSRADQPSFDSLENPLIPIKSPEKEKAIQRFEQSALLNGVRIKIENCAEAFSVSGGENVSYVASCTLATKRFPVMICNDNMTGSFSLSVTFAKTPKSMANFLFNHCYGG